MTTNQAMFVFISGLLLTFGAVGGIEQSINDEQLTGSLLLAVIGLLGMYAGTLGFRNAHMYD
jgi:xanthine/uracil/vitamin C permease (AzgA family)